MLAAVQHERAARPSVAVQHQLALQKLGYSFSRQQNFIPSPAPLTFSAIPPLHTYSGLVPFSDSFPHNSFLDRASVQDFPASRLPENVQLNPLASTQGPLSSFKIPLFSTSLHYPVPHPGYFPTNIFYPPMISSDAHSSTIESEYFLHLMQ